MDCTLTNNEVGEISVGVPATDRDARIVYLKNRAERPSGVADYEPVFTPETGHQPSSDEADDNGQEHSNR